MAQQQSQNGFGVQLRPEFLQRGTRWKETIIRNLDAYKTVAFGVGAMLMLCGCSGPNPRAEPFGKTYYLDGAGNWGYGVATVRAGLAQAGYQGDCEVYPWSHTLNPILDQMNVLGAKFAAVGLANRIRAYKERFPEQEVNLIALSAGTGVVVWALEELEGDCQVNNVFLLGSSLSSTYDMRKALESVEGKVYVYYSHWDELLKMVQVFGLGTIDRRLGVKSAGQVGLRGPGSKRGRVVNIGWRRKWARLGWYGEHTDCVKRRFVRHEIAKKLMKAAGIKNKPTGQAKADEESDSTTVHGLLADFVQ